MQVPDSSFGHIFLVTHFKNTPLENSTVINYAAPTGNDAPLTKIYKGAVGSYRGKYTESRYRNKLKSYIIKEKRYVWEYELNLNDDEIKRLYAHYYELKVLRNDYFFLDENCGCAIMFLLQCARYDSSLTNNGGFFIPPIKFVFLLHDGNFINNAPKIITLEESKIIKTVKNDPPHKRHRLNCVSASFGVNSYNPYTSISYHPLYHTLIDPQLGYSSYSDITILEIGLRYYYNKTFTVNNFTLIDAVNYGVDDNKFLLSWRFSAGQNKIFTNSKNPANNYFLNGGVGYSAMPINNFLLFVFLLSDSNISFSSDDYLTGAGINIGNYANLRYFSIKPYVKYFIYPVFAYQTKFTAGIDGNIPITENLNITMKYSFNEFHIPFHEAEVGINIYF